MVKVGPVQITGVLVLLALACAAEIKEYGPVYENDVCEPDYIKTTSCKEVEINIFEQQYCCKVCPDGYGNPDPEHFNSCEKKEENRSTEAPQVEKPSSLSTTTISMTSVPFENETEESEERDQTKKSINEPTGTLEETTVNSTDGIGEEKLPEEKFNAVTIAVIVLSIIIFLVLSALAVQCIYKRYIKPLKLDNNKDIPLGGMGDKADAMERQPFRTGQNNEQ